MYFFSFSTATGEMNICSDAQHFQRANRKRTAFVAVRFLFSEGDSKPTVKKMCLWHIFKEER